MIFRKLFRPLFDGGEGGGGASVGVLPEWISTTFSEDVRKDPAFAPLFNASDPANLGEISRYKTPVDLLRGISEKNAIIGKKGVIVPADFDKAKPEELEAFYAGIGRPKTADEYKFSELKDLHPALKIDDAASKSFKEFLFKAGVPAKQADAFNQYASGYLSNMLKAGEEASKKAQEKAIGELKAAWGADYPAKLEGATKLVKAVLGDKAADLGNLENTPAGLMFLEKLSTVISQDSIDKITTGGGQQMPEQEQALKTIEEIKADARGAKTHPMNDPKHADHNKWNGTDGEWTKLHAVAYPGK